MTKTTYRFAKGEDVPSLVEFGRDIHAQSRYAWIPYKSRRVWTLLEESLKRNQYTVVLAIQGQEIVGVLYAHAAKFLFSDDYSARIELFYVVPRLRGSPVAMQLLGAFRRWAKNRQATEIVLQDGFGDQDKNNRKLFGHLGMPVTATVHTMWLDR